MASAYRVPEPMTAPMASIVIGVCCVNKASWLLLCTVAN